MREKFYALLDGLSLLRYLLNLSRTAFELRSQLMEGESPETVEETARKLVAYVEEISSLLKMFSLPTLPEPEPRIEYRDHFVDPAPVPLPNPWEGSYGAYRIVPASGTEPRNYKIPLIKALRTLSALGLGLAKKVVEDSFEGKGSLYATNEPRGYARVMEAAKLIEEIASVKVVVQSKHEDGVWRILPREETP